MMLQIEELTTSVINVFLIQAYFGNIPGLVPDHQNKANTAIRQVK